MLKYIALAFVPNPFTGCVIACCSDGAFVRRLIKTIRDVMHTPTMAHLLSFAPIRVLFVAITSEIVHRC